MATPLAGTLLHQPPDPDSVEVSLIGPGFGECVIIHLPGGRWIVIDSCRSRSSKNPVALDYFSSLGVAPETAVNYIIASHWHDDHVKGIAKLFEACRSAKFVCAAPLAYKEFQKIIGIYRKYLPAGGRGIDEIIGVIKILEQRKHANEIIAPVFAMERCALLNETTPRRISLTALSPSSAASLAVQVRLFSDLCPDESSERLDVPDLKPNDLAVVLALEIDEAKVLLGADLEEDGRAGIGWQAVVSNFASSWNGFQGFKIPHHGSSNGHYGPVWTQMMSSVPWAVMTPYSRGTAPLPTETDVARILALTPDAFITSTNVRKEAKIASNTVQRTLREMGVKIMEEPCEQGHIRMRKTLGTSTDWTVEMFGSAKRLSI